MKIVKLAEYGYEESALGFSLSFNTSIERAKELLPKYAWGKVAGENKFLRVIQLWFDIDFPRAIYPEVDQYKVGTTTLSESTIHTLHKKPLSQEDFEVPMDQRSIDVVNEKIQQFKNKEISLLDLKCHLPEGFLQRRIWNLNYANLQNIVNQRTNHKLKLWNKIIEEIVSQVDHPEFILKPKEIYE